MATPLGHGLTGYAIGLALSRGRPASPVPLCAGAFFAIAPDLDFLPGLLQGQPALYHQGVTHSVFVGIAVAVVACLAPISGWKRRSVFVLVLAAWSSHLALDLFGPDKRLPYGIPLLWPLAGTPFLSPVPLLLGMRHAGRTSATTGEWLDGILSAYNILALTVEVAVVVPVLLLARRHAGRWT